MVERELKECFLRAPFRYVIWDKVRHDEAVNLKPKLRIVDARRLCVLEYSLESYAEFSDRCLGFGGVGD